MLCGRSTREYHYVFCAVVAHKAATLVLRRGVRRSFSDGGEVMAHPPYGSAQKERIRFALYCVAVILHRFLCQGVAGRLLVASCESEKGERHFAAGAV